jgi:hypothetical protein
MFVVLAGIVGGHGAFSLNLDLTAEKSDADPTFEKTGSVSDLKLATTKY